jgi:hypothetical protein
MLFDKVRRRYSRGKRELRKGELRKSEKKRRIVLS